MGKFWNAIWNTLGLAPRAWWTVALAGLDTLQAWANVFTDVGNVIKDTKNRVREVLSSPYAKGPMKWYHRVGGALTSPFIGAATLVEGAVRTVVEPTRNAVLNVRDILGNSLKNFGESLLWAFDSKKPVSDFSFNHLQWKEPTRKNRMSKLAWWNKKAPLPETIS